MSSLDAFALPAQSPSPPARNEQSGASNLLAVCWRQWRVESALARRGVHFRSTDPHEVAAAYAAMSEKEFEAINGRQQWANWRTIPRALANRLPDRPLVVVDLGCGVGSSTRVLTQCCPEGSTFFAYEYARPLLTHARRRSYRHGDGSVARVTFLCQGIDETLSGPRGDALPDRSVDLIHASGVFGHHFDCRTVLPAIREVRRIAAPGSLALLDDGPTLGAADLRRLMHDAGFEPLDRYRSWFGAPVGQTLFRRRGQILRARTAATLLSE
jgi:SAM-dependent methyltransferase